MPILNLHTYVLDLLEKISVHKVILPRLANLFLKDFVFLETTNENEIVNIKFTAISFCIVA